MAILMAKWSFERSLMGRSVFFLLGMALLSLFGCSNEPPSTHYPVKGEYLYRRHEDVIIQISPIASLPKPQYPWEEKWPCSFSKITKDFFRCQGSSLNPFHLVQRGKESVRFYDCGGALRHSLPLRDKKEFIYPILIDLLNAIQAKTGKRVVITCGHCCPDHNAYLDPSPSNQASKHMIGAEVDFYVQGMELQPDGVVDLILDYFREQPKYAGKKEFQEFKRYEKPLKNVSIPPWYNKEVFVKLYQKHEGRDSDNRHPYPYLSIQVRYDVDKGEPVVYTWDKAFRNFHRW